MSSLRTTEIAPPFHIQPSILPPCLSTLPSPPTIPIFPRKSSATKLNALKALLDAVAVPGKALIGSCRTRPGWQSHLAGLVAQGATGYDIALRVPGTAVFGLVAVNVPTADFHFPPLPAGSYSAMVAGRNAAGLGEWSDALDFTLA